MPWVYKIWLSFFQKSIPFQVIDRSDDMKSLEIKIATLNYLRKAIFGV